MIESISYLNILSTKTTSLSTLLIQVTIIFMAMISFFVYLLLRLYWITAVPENDNVLIKGKAQSSIIKGVCPFCLENHYSDETLKVGYRKPKIDYFRVNLGRIEWKSSMNELNASLPICEKCKKKYLFLCNFKLFARIGLDRSYLVLQRKIGYYRGKQYPLETWNINKIENI